MFFFMSDRIVSSFTAFCEAFPHLNAGKSSDPKAAALAKYFGDGGVISVKANGSDWPTLVYPSKQRLETQIDSLSSLKSRFEKEKAVWEKKLIEEKLYHFRNNVYKFSEPVYWKHLFKILTNFEYKHDAGEVSLPAHLISDKRWKPMIKMFVDNIEYRKQLVETVQQGIVYKDDKRVGRYANDLRDFRIDVSAKKISELTKKVQTLDEQINSLKQIMGWAKAKE